MTVDDNYINHLARFNAIRSKIVGLDISGL